MKSKRQTVAMSETKMNLLSEIAQRYEVSKPDIIKIAIQKFIDQENKNEQ